MNYCKLEIAFKCQTKLSNCFPFKDLISKYLIYRVAYKFQCGICNKSYCGESISLLDIRSGEHIGVSHLTKKKFKSVNNRAAHDHLLYCIYLSSFDNFSILARENKKFLFEIKESLLIIMIDKPLLNRRVVLSCTIQRCMIHA